MTMKEFLLEFKWFFLMPVIIGILNGIFKIIKDIAQGAYLGDIREELEKRTHEMIKEEEQKIDIDKDLKKYFNYKESKDV